ncbi:hypothetical protein GJ744_000849 [Endocarpon pusillum]|uniref:Uncharacterized protein n=1 Tax=Endocarpon pusillum TaxID=364733 RepID=A0A8H7ANX4_9EURO|nr:hypothetical protein GJ744_000849 [Endocarpon pusillum]
MAEKEVLTIYDIKLRESMSPINFAPPDLDRLGQPYQRTPRTHEDPSLCDQSDELCRTCSSIDLLSLFKNGLPSDHGGPVPLQRGVPLGYSDQIEANVRCPLCRIVVDVVNEYNRGDVRKVEFWSLKPVFGYQALTFVKEISEFAAQARPEASPSHVFHISGSRLLC